MSCFEKSSATFTHSNAHNLKLYVRVLVVVIGNCVRASPAAVALWLTMSVKQWFM